MKTPDTTKAVSSATRQGAQIIAPGGLPAKLKTVAAQVLARCEAMGLPATTGPLWPVLVSAIERDPTAAVRALGVDLSAPKVSQTL